MKDKIEKIIISLVVSIIPFSIIALFYIANSNIDSYTVVRTGDRKVINITKKGKIGTTTEIHDKITVLKVRIDDDSEYHLTYKMNGVIYNDSDLNKFECTISDKTDESWVVTNNSNYHIDHYYINYPIEKIVYFED